MERPGWSLYWQTFLSGCSPCSPGAYKPQPGPQPCLPCPAAQYAAAAQSDAVGVGAQGGGRACAACPANTTAPAGTASAAQTDRGTSLPTGAGNTSPIATGRTRITTAGPGPGPGPAA